MRKPTKLPPRLTKKRKTPPAEPITADRNKSNGLSVRQQIFVREYAKDKNATRAFVAAGYGRKGANAGASRMLSNGKVRKAVDAALARLAVKIEYSAVKNLRAIAEIAYYRPGVKASDQLRAQELLGKHFKQFTDVSEIGGKDGGPLVILTMPANGSEAPESPTEPQEPEQLATEGEPNDDGHDG